MHIEDLLNRALVQVRGTKMEEDPMNSVYTNLERPPAFNESQKVAEAAVGLVLDGIKFGEMCLRVRRRNGFNADLIATVKAPKELSVGMLGIVLK